jgi:hypothetical protein
MEMKDRHFRPTLFIHLSALIYYDIASVMPIHILPGETDPSGVIMPQQPLPRAMFGAVAKLPTFCVETNPTYLRFACGLQADSRNVRTCGIRTLLVNSGQPLNDIFKYLPSHRNTRSVDIGVYFEMETYSSNRPGYTLVPPILQWRSIYHYANTRPIHCRQSGEIRNKTCFGGNRKRTWPRRRKHGYNVGS